MLIIGLFNVMTNHFRVTVDMVVFFEGEVLLIQRKHDPYLTFWALPGGFVEMEEELEDAAVRELEEETGLQLNADQIHQLGAYAAIGRDPRGRTLSVVYCARLNEKALVSGADDALDAHWFSLNELPKLAFDHDMIIEDANVKMN